MAQQRDCPRQSRGTRIAIAWSSFVLAPAACTSRRLAKSPRCIQLLMQRRLPGGLAEPGALLGNAAQANRGGERGRARGGDSHSRGLVAPRRHTRQDTKAPQAAGPPESAATVAHVVQATGRFWWRSPTQPVSCQSDVERCARNRPDNGVIFADARWRCLRPLKGGCGTVASATPSRRPGTGR